MCGICGVLDLGAGPVTKHELAGMTEALRLRGPDDEGFYSDGVAALGHRRLSIVDVAGGHQPLISEDGQVLAVANGEIYNHLDLRAELLALGHTFRTRSDNEVLVHGYEAWGEEVIERLDGMFALAVWDQRERRLLLARDRFGKKPLAWFSNAGRLVFASTLTALLRHPEAPRRIDRLALARYLAFEFVPAPGSIVAGIQKLPAATLLVATPRGTERTRRYWTLPVASGSPAPSRAEASERIRALLDAAVRRRLMSDRPLGVLLSGGLDSSSVVASAAALGVQPLRTFSIGFGEPSFDESRWARDVARRFGAEHVEERMTAETMLEVVPHLGEILDEPMADGSIVPTYLLCRLAHQFVTVALGGDGGDELFAGYPTYIAHRLAGLAGGLLTPPLVALLERAAAWLPVSDRNLSLEFKLKKTLEGLRYPREIRNYVWLGAFPPDRLGALLSEPPSDLDELARPVAEAYPAVGGASHLERVMEQDIRLYLCHEILCKVDRASMANSLEVRAPFLDTRLAEYVAGLPLAMKLRGLRTKSVLREAMAGRLDPAVLHRPKKGFGMPIGRWLRGPLRPLASDLLDGLSGTGWFRKEALIRLQVEHDRLAFDRRKPLWALMTLELWRRHHGITC